MFQNLYDLIFTLVLDLVYNPLGAFLPPDESQLEAKYKEELKEAFGIEFNSLYTMTNMPIKRFADFLRRRNEMKPYLDLLVRSPSLFSGSGLDLVFELFGSKVISKIEFKSITNAFQNSLRF